MPHSGSHEASDGIPWQGERGQALKGQCAESRRQKCPEYPWGPVHSAPRVLQQTPGGSGTARTGKAKCCAALFSSTA